MSTTISEPAPPTTHPAVAPASRNVRMRASDAEREDVVRRLHAAVGEGRLDLDEAESRTTTAYATRYRDELAPLVADLPGGGPVTGVPTWSWIREALVWRAHLLVRGPDAARPTAAQCRTAVRLAWVAVAWFVFCAVLGALVVGA
ncbi:DUF1707 SHOCT-like domain-containing protein [Pseudonocardia endophytica]|uniref:Uncharacterized protein DUF1707 n=1 Tax=Pseudonocardia endophytica TaxID=401976 RepID=A0A4R1HMJ8_PSEEN|nr:DUF1707 domain-containing protein [Pseudonocardia endophytica]TCK22371.1 uncharacterized protein DUF1707 [Pseudonocardia endophytica]